MNVNFDDPAVKEYQINHRQREMKQEISEEIRRRKTTNSPYLYWDDPLEDRIKEIVHRYESI